MSEFNLLITGLCSFVPSPPMPENPDKSYKLDEMTVLLAESQTPFGPMGHMHGQHELHVPVLVCPEMDVFRGEGFRLPDMTFQPTPYSGNQDSGDLMAVFYLDDQHVTIRPDKLNDLAVDLTEVENCSGSHTSFRWVVPLEEVNPGAETVKDGCLERWCDASVISRVQLTHGLITTAKLATNINHEILRWYFEEADTAGSKGPGGLDQGRAIAAVVGVLFDLDGKQGIEFTTSLLHKSSSNRRVEAIFALRPEEPLKIRIEPKSSFRKVWIKNMPWLDILQIRKLKDPTCDVHFADIYKLSKGTVRVAKVPCTTGETCEDQDFRHGAGTDCPFPRMQTSYSK